MCKEGVLTHENGGHFAGGVLRGDWYVCTLQHALHTVKSRFVNNLQRNNFFFWNIKNVFGFRDPQLKVSFFMNLTLCGHGKYE